MRHAVRAKSGNAAKVGEFACKPDQSIKELILCDRLLMIVIIWRPAGVVYIGTTREDGTWQNSLLSSPL